MIVASQLDYERRPTDIVIVVTHDEAAAVLEALYAALSIDEASRDGDMESEYGGWIDPASRPIVAELERRLAAITDPDVAL